MAADEPCRLPPGVYQGGIPEANPDAFRALSTTVHGLVIRQIRQRDIERDAERKVILRQIRKHDAAREVVLVCIALLRSLKEEAVLQDADRNLARGLDDA